MPNLPPSSTPSPACRLEWRPSRQELAALLALTLLAAFALLHCDLPPALAWPGAGMAVVSGAVSLWRNARRPRRDFVLARALAECRVDGEPVSRLQLRWRGALLFLRWQYPGQRRWRHAVFWPDTLTASQRRDLRLIAPGTESKMRS